MNESGQAGGLLSGTPDKPLPRRPIKVVGLQRLQDRGHPRQWRAQFVRGIREELGPEGLKVRRFGFVGQVHSDAAVKRGERCPVGPPAIGEYPHGERPPFAVLQTRGNGPGEEVLPEGLQNRHPDRDARETLTRKLVDRRNARVGGDDKRRDRGEIVRRVVVR